MRVWILQTGEPLPCDGENVRPMRAINLANELLSRGHEVILWSSDFYHQEKRSRYGQDKEITISDKLKVRLLTSWGYRRNIGLARLIDHYQMAKALRLWLRSDSELPDVAFIGFPPIEVAFVMNRWMRERGIPTILDVKDQWPHIFVDRSPSWIRPLVRLSIWPYFLLAKRTFSEASALSAMSASFLEWSCEFAGRVRAPTDQVVPLTTPRRISAQMQTHQADQWWAEQGVDISARRVVSFIGSMTGAFNFDVIAKTARAAQQSQLPVQFVVCGDGDEKAKVHALLRDIPNVVMPGWIHKEYIHSLSKFTLATLAPYRNTKDFQMSIPNKVLDSLSNGLPILTTLDGEVSELVGKNRVGFHGSENDAQWMLAAIRDLVESPTLWSDMSKRCNDLYSDQFECASVYAGFADALERMAKPVSF